MNNRIRETFDKIHAEEQLKIRTKEAILERTKVYSKRKSYHCKVLIPVMTCFFFLAIGFGGYWMYFVPVSLISIDINPSIELGINRFDKVTSVKGYNEDGQILADSLEIQHMNYMDALDQILEDKKMLNYMEEEGQISIAVVGQNEQQSEQMLEDVEIYTSDRGNVHCTMSNHDEIKAAHEANLSFGKYQAYLELQQLNPDITVEDVRGMTMREIRDIIETLSADIALDTTSETEKTNAEEETERSHSKHEHKNEYGERKRQRKGY